MGRIGLSVVKRATFRDSTQEWGNTYFYGAVGTNPNESDAQAMITEVANAEKLFHATSVSFIRARLWSAGGTPTQNQTIAEAQLSGAGALTPLPTMDIERAFLVYWPAGRDVRGRQVFLRKWYHTCAGIGGVAVSTAILANQTGFTQAQRDTIAAACDTITRIGPLEGWGLVAENGRERDGGAPLAHKYLEHHQLGDQWRAA
jgi:hypothetical protein